MSSHFDISAGDRQPVVIALKHNGTLVPWADLSAVTCTMVKRSGTVPTDVINPTVTENTDDPTNYNAQLNFAAGDTDAPGQYLWKVHATLNGLPVSFPDNAAGGTAQIWNDLGG